MTGRSFLVFALLPALAVGTAVGMAIARSAYPPVDVLYSGDRTVIGQTITYPDGEPRVTGAIITMPAGTDTGRHIHAVPLFAYVLQGRIEVDYGPDGIRSYQAGDAFLEAYRTPHSGRTIGDETVRILAVFIGAQGMENTELQSK